MKLPARTLRVVLYEGEGSQPLANADRFAMMATLLQGGYAVTAVRRGSKAAPDGMKSPLVILGRFTGQTPAEATGDGDVPVFFRDIDGVEPSAVAGVVESVHTDAGTSKPGGW